jgi:hypothetical protein
MSWSKLITAAAPALVVILAVAYVFAGKESVPEALVAWGTIVLAYTTFLLVQENKQQSNQNRKDALDREERYLKTSHESEQRYRQAETEKEERYRKDQIDREARERKERLADEMRRWALDLWNSQVPMSMDVRDTMELAKLGSLGEKARVAFIKGNTELKIASVLAEASYVREMAEIVFKQELGEVFKHIDTEVSALGYLNSLDAGVSYEIKPIDPNVIKELKQELASKNKTLVQLLNEHRNLLRTHLGTLLIKIADIKASLL